MADQDFMTLGPVHLEVRDPERTGRFWEDLFGFQRQSIDGGSIAVGSGEETLVVLHGGARAPYASGHSGLYHVAIHSPDARDFARILKRLLDRKYPFSSIDHTYSKAFYLDDPDGINIEITLETPERLKEYVFGPGSRLTFVGSDGVGRSGAFALDLDKVYDAYEVDSELKPAALGTKVGHVHLYVSHLEKARDFYAALGMKLALWWPPMQVADFAAGGPFPHRIAINTWQGIGTSPSPAGTARMRHFEIRFATQEHLQTALAANPAAVAVGDTYEVTDSSGITLRLGKRLAWQTGEPVRR